MNGTISWTDRVNTYLSYRRSVGFSPLPESLYLPQFARFAEQQHASRLTVQLAMDWACTAKRPTLMTRAYRLLRLRGFAKYCQKFDPDTEIPPLGLFGRTQRRLVPHIYTEQELAELLEATSKLHARDGLRPLTYRTLYGLLACCGLRIGEAIRLTRTDVDLDSGVLSICGTKRHKSRFVPLHVSAVRALAAYAQERDRRALWPQSDHFFLLDNGTPRGGPASVTPCIDWPTSSGGSPGAITHTIDCRTFATRLSSATFCVPSRRAWRWIEWCWHCRLMSVTTTLPILIGMSPAFRS